MSFLPGLLILTALGSSASHTRSIDAEQIFYCDFGRSWDVNYDLWPDTWQRKLGPGLPHYIDVQLQNDETAVAGRCLTASINGGGVLLHSRPEVVSDKFSYLLEAKLRISNLQHSQVQLRIEFCDEQRQVLQTNASQWYRTTKGWTKVRIGPIHPKGNNIRLARIILQVQEGEHVDLDGTVSLDDVWLARMPKMVVESNSPFNVYTEPGEIKVTCKLSGILEKDPDIHFELLDASSQRLDDETRKLEGQLINERMTRASDIISLSTERIPGFEGNTEWHPPITDYGFYQVRVTMRSSKGVMSRHVISIAVVPPLNRPQQGEFGWSLAGYHLPLSYDQLTVLLPRVAIHWLKLSIWYDATQGDQGDQLVHLTERLSTKDIEVVGVVDQPPKSSDLHQQVSASTSVADLMSLNPTSWLPSLDPVVTRLSMRVHWWQLGKDRDTSFTGFSQIEDEIGMLRDQMFRFGQDIRLGIGWQWPNGRGMGKPATWDFQQYSANPALSNEELANYLQMPRRPEVDRWVLIEPLSNAAYDLPARVHDLVGQMLTAKIHGADAIFLADPFNDDHGLMTSDGTPGELLLPWRTTASMLGGTKHIGSIQLPGGSENHIFKAANGNVVMVVWNRTPTREILYLGEDIRVIDVWGRGKKPKNQAHRQIIHANALPIFVDGLNPYIAQWRMQVRFGQQNIPSVFGKAHANSLHLQNQFPQGAGGEVRIIVPKRWQTVPQEIPFKLAAEESEDLPFEITLPFSANSGKRPIRLDFNMSVDHEYQFSVFRSLDVGVGDVEIEVQARLDQDGVLNVEQRLANRSGELVDLKCLLYAPGRRRQRRQIFRLGDNIVNTTYRYPNGEDLLGAEFWLRIEELGGSRVLNHRFVAE
jgi:hypothetical protein